MPSKYVFIFFVLLSLEKKRGRGNHIFLFLFGLHSIAGSVCLRQPFPCVMSLSTITVAESTRLVVKTKNVALPLPFAVADGIQSDLVNIGE